MRKPILCWDESYFEKNDGVSVIAHKPVKKELALVCDDEWEGPQNGYASVLKIGQRYRIYYRADNARQRIDGQKTPGAMGVICMAESYDGGITYRKPNIGKYEYNGTKNNNIVFLREEHPIDNFSVFYDTNPACPEDERFKALSEINFGNDNGGTKLIYYASADGIDFREMYYLDVQGTFDSYNVMVWDENTEQYFLYYRAFHTPEGEDKLSWRGARPNWLRHIRVATSKDFKVWEKHGRISFTDGQKAYQMYTNQITRYYRSRDTFIGFPVRYFDRAEEKQNFRHMPLGDRHENITKVYGREGTAVTDCVIMTSQDGFKFNCRDEAFLTPGAESRSNWWYGNCYTVYGLIETASDEAGASNEISFYMGENYRIKNVNFRRYTVRLDGFFSWYAPYKGSDILTKPFTVEAQEMRVNFATSALGGLNVCICSEDGEELAGYKSYTMFGDSTDRPVEFEKQVSELIGKRVRIRFTLSDAHLYSFEI